jgi:hypothetical protein
LNIDYFNFSCTWLLLKHKPVHLSSNLHKYLLKKRNFIEGTRGKMVTVIKKGSPPSKILKLLKKLQLTHGLDAHKFCGVIHLKEDALIIQQRMRNEWE